MTQPPIHFDDGAAYERLMGVWSRSVGEGFLDFLRPAPGQHWVDVGCGNGAFTDLVVRRCAPRGVQGIDHSAEQVAYARGRIGAAGVEFRQGDALALPFADAAFDVAVMALVIHFLPEPARGVAEMARVVRPGGTVAAYVWDYVAGHSPMAPFDKAFAAAGVASAVPPGVAATSQAALRALWTDAGLVAVETVAIEARRTFADFDDLWGAMTGTGRLSAAALEGAALEAVRADIRRRLPADADGRITYAGVANAIRGRVPG